MTPATKALPTKVKCEFESVVDLLSYYTYQEANLPIFFGGPALIFLLTSTVSTSFIPCMLQVFWEEAVIS